MRLARLIIFGILAGEAYSFFWVWQQSAIYTYNKFIISFLLVLVFSATLGLFLLTFIDSDPEDFDTDSSFEDHSPPFGGPDNNEFRRRFWM